MAHGERLISNKAWAEDQAIMPGVNHSALLYVVAKLKVEHGLRGTVYKPSDLYTNRVTFNSIAGSFPQNILNVQEKECR